MISDGSLRRPPGDTGGRIAGFVVEAELGRGAHSTVYRVCKAGTAGTYALKILDASSGSQREMAAFRREAALLASVNDANLTAIHEVGAVDGRPYLVMDLVEGVSLAGVLAAGALTPERVITLARDVAGPLAALHRRGIVHNDVKPDNLMVLPDGTARLIDFSLAGWGAGDQGEATVGTLAYASPEQSGMLRRPVDQRSDLYSLGVVLFECLAGVAPFTAADVADLLRMHAVATPPDLADLVPGIPSGLVTVVATLLAKDPDDRYQSGEQLTADLDLLAANPDATAAGGSPASDQRSSSPLVGRVREMGQLTARWTATRAGTGSTAVIRGPGGSGKSRLAAELADQVAAAGGLALHGKSSADDSVPLATLRDALDGHLRQVDRLPAEDRERELIRIRAAAAPGAGMLAGLLPALADLSGSPAGEPDGAAGPDQFTLATAGFLVSLARERGALLLWLDDIQWLDDGTLRVLSQLAEQLADAPLMVLATARDDPDSAATTDTAVASLGASVKLDVTLGPLSDADVAELVHTMLPGLNADPALARMLNVRGSGNPFIIQEYLLAIVDAGLLLPSWGTWQLDADALDTLELPQEALGLVLARARNLGPEVRELLVTAACIGARFDLDVVAAVHGIDIEAVLAAVTQATARGLTEPAAAGRYAFVHDRIREALREQLDPEALGELHRRIAEALTGLPGEPDTERVYQVARQYLTGRADATSERVFAACWAAGQQALNDFATADAVAFLRHATPGGAANGHFLAALGKAYSQNGEFAPAIETLNQALTVDTDQPTRARIRTLLAATYRTTYRLEQAMGEVEQGLAELGAPLPRNRLRLVLSTASRLLTAIGMHSTGWRPGSAREADRARYRMITELHEMGASTAEQSVDVAGILTHCARLLYWGNRLDSGPRYITGQAMYGFYAGCAGLGNVARRAFARAAADPSADEPALRALIDLRRGIELYMNFEDDGEAFVASFEQHNQWMDLGDYCSSLSMLVLRAVTQGRLSEAKQWIELGRRRLALGADETTPMVFDQATVLAATGRRVDTAEELRRMHQQVAAGHESPVMRLRAVVARLIALTEENELGELFDRAVSDLQSIQAGFKIHPRITDCQFFVAMGRLAQCRLAQGRLAQGPTPARLAAARSAIRELARTRRGGEQRSRTRIARADLLVLQGRPRKALAVLDGGDPRDRRDAPKLAYETARVRARALHALGATDEADRTARQAHDIAEENGWPHRAGWIATEFGPLAGHGPADSIRSTATAFPAGYTTISGHAGKGPSAAAGLDRQRLSALEEVGAAAARVLDPGELARIALDQTIRVLSAERAFLFLTAPDGRLTPHLGRNTAGEDIAELTGYSASLVERVHRSNQPVVVTGSEEGAALGAQSVVLHGLRSIMVAPLQLEGRQLGVVYLDSQIAKGIFDADDAGLLIALTNHIATSLETARAAQLEISVQAARRQRDLADTLRHALEEMAGTLEPPEVLARLLHWTTTILPAQRGWLLTTDSDDDSCILSELDDDGRLAQRTLAIDALSALPHSTTTLADHPGLIPAEIRAQLVGATSWLAVPMRTRTGVLVLGSQSPGARLGDHTELASALVAQGMTAYDRATLFTQVQALAVIDELTGIPNRRHFMQVAERDTAAATRAGRPLTALMIDIDHFKTVNDTHGHPTGDDVIRTVASRLAGQIRATDLVGRYGGEEFAAILQDAKIGSELPELMRTSIGELPIDTRSGPLTITVSIGVAQLRDDDANLKDLLARADHALYEAKRAGRNRVHHT